MKEWHITNSTQTYTLLTDQVTLLKGNVDNWTFVLDDLTTYFSHQSSNTEVKENETSIPKQDYHFSLLSFSEQIISKDFDKTLNQIQTEFFGLLQLSPFYKQLVDNWEELMDEVELLSDQNSLFPIPFKLHSFSNDSVKKSLYPDIKQKEKLSALDHLLLKLSMVEQTNRSKNILFGLIYPENQLTNSELQQLDNYLQSDTNHSQYFIISNNDFTAAKNVLYKGNILTKQNCWQKKEQLQSVLPIEWNEQQFLKACNWYMYLVDNYQEKTVLLKLESVDNLTQFIYVYSLFLLTNTPVIVDLAGVPISIINYFDNLIAGKV